MVPSLVPVYGIISSTCLWYSSMVPVFGTRFQSHLRYPSVVPSLRAGSVCLDKLEASLLPDMTERKKEKKNLQQQKTLDCNLPPRPAANRSFCSALPSLFLCRPNLWANINTHLVRGPAKGHSYSLGRPAMRPDTGTAVGMRSGRGRRGSRR